MNDTDGTDALSADGTDAWAALRRHTPARIAIGRTGGSQRTASLLDFRLAHAQARDAVHAPFDAAALAAQLAAHGLASEQIHTAVNGTAGTGAVARDTYLVRPDLGRRLDDASREKLRSLAAQWGRRDLAIILSDGLAACAAAHHAAAVVVPLTAQLADAGWTHYPVLIVPSGRVKLQDEIGEILGARHT
ncbi:MAG: ethanolamine ammonia-lyase subunit EutC, partial [Puniceicoccales bacterium]|nr:ethanolamine ammonia-lyase subunit EutC [Puniceicoccales bacterium]